jgi:hypothetical protein
MNVVVERRSPVSPDYRHIVKIVRHAPSLALGESILKWYDIAPANRPVPAEIRQLARDNLRTAASFAELDLDADLGFVILHRCGESFYFLLVCTWRGDHFHEVQAMWGEQPACLLRKRAGSATRCGPQIVRNQR